MIGWLSIVIGLVAAGVVFPQQNTNRAHEDSGSSVNIKNTEAVLIAKYMILRGDEALLVTDPREIKELTRLFSNNGKVGHACAYHWLIWFRESPLRSIPFSHNEDCEIYLVNNEQIHAVLKTYFNTIRQQPTHFISNLKIVSSVEPLEAVRKLESASHKVFIFDGTEQHLPRVKLEARAVSKIPKSKQQWDRASKTNLLLAKRRLQNAIDVVKTHYPLGNASELDNRYSSFGGGQIEHRVETTVYLPYGTNLERVEVPKGITILEKRIPTYYMLQLVSAERLSDRSKEQLLSTNPFLLGVFRFPKVE